MVTENSEIKSKVFDQFPGSGMISPKPKDPTLLGAISNDDLHDAEIFIAQAHPDLPLADLIITIDEVGDRFNTVRNNRISLLAAYLNYRKIDPDVISILSDIPEDELLQNQVDVYTDFNLGTQLVMIHSMLPSAVAVTR